MIKKEVIDRIGCLDERFFMYYEEVDWCWRGREAGYQCLLVPQAHVFHPDTRIRDEDSVTVTYYSSRNRLFLAQKHHLGWLALCKMLSSSFRQLLSWTIRPKWRAKAAQRYALSAALVDFLRQKHGRWEAD